jgi:hypothetical protein
VFRAQKRLGRKSRDQRGAALVEAAIVLLPLCLIVFGIIEFGFVFKDSLTLSSATRAGARTASAEPRNQGFYTDTVEATRIAGSAAKFANGDELFIYKANAAGLPLSGDATSCGTSCVRYLFSNGNWVQSGGGGWSVSTQKACLGSDFDSVGVSLRLTHKSVTGFFPFLNDMKLREHTVMRLEPLDSSCT